jgi:hypothetical protein
MVGFDLLSAGAVALAAMLLVSLAAAIVMPKGARLPMQWDWRGKPTWSLPVWFAVFFTPALALIITACAFTLAEGKARVITDSVLPLLLVIHVAHLFFAGRHASRNKN